MYEAFKRTLKLHNKKLSWNKEVTKTTPVNLLSISSWRAPSNSINPSFCKKITSDEDDLKLFKCSKRARSCGYPSLENIFLEWFFHKSTQQEKASHKKNKYKQETETIKEINIISCLLKQHMNMYVANLAAVLGNFDMDIYHISLFP